jgi:MinD-like ATPase involved in chromosome partitioning or flagellar assembly
MSPRVFVVVGAKGGAGATTIAIKLVQRFPTLGERMIVDADLSGKRTLAVWYDLSDDLDVGRVVGSVAVAAAGDGALVMEVARTYEDGLILSPSSITHWLTGLSERALIVVDAPQPLAATVRPFIVRATKIIVVTEPTRLGVSAAHAVLSAMQRAGITPARVALVVSDIAGTGNVPRAEVERALGMPVSAELPNERDRRYQGLFDGLVTTLSAAAATYVNPLEGVEKPVFDRRLEPGEALL